jgi:hypothetical protein
MGTKSTRAPGAGRPTKLTPAVLAQIREAVLFDCYFEVACRAAGITKKTGYNWKERGEKEADRVEADEVPNDAETLYMEFYLAIDQAEAQAEMEDIKYIRGGFPEWTGKAWIRERKSHQRWGKIERHEVTGADGGALLVRWDGNRNIAGSPLETTGSATAAVR